MSIPADAYHLEFNTKEMPGMIVCVEVQLRRRIGRDHDTFRVDLSDHPLYPALERYVLANPTRKTR
jgi:hypothetical protein